MLLRNLFKNSNIFGKSPTRMIAVQKVGTDLYIPRTTWRREQAEAARIAEEAKNRKMPENEKYDLTYRTPQSYRLDFDFSQ